ncbi:MAG: aminotransferase class I/II-fold pyridoxal phosphate-dependent enzyme [Candidatus Thorarchaeota archaeon]|nr:aminotransferase class I/II-fold pyridoxal phosphate-dependent enzyme [Candidatus Thorarchaeota archaeon]
MAKEQRLKHLELSLASKKLPPSATLAMNELIAAKRESGEMIYHMGFGQSPFPVHPLVRKALCKNSWRQDYLPTQGVHHLRQTVSEFYRTLFSLEYTPEQIVIGPGSKPLMFAALTALNGPIFLPAPSWVSYQHMGHFLDRDVYHVRTTSEDSYRLTPETLQNSIKENTPDKSKQKVLVLNYPCNPTGHSFDASHLKELAEIAKENNMLVLSDEIYALTHFRDHEHQSMAKFYPEGTLITGGLSKDRSLGGYRLGVLLLPAGEKELLRAILAIGSEIWSSVASPIQYAAIEAYRTDTGLVEYIRDCAGVHEIVTRYSYQRLRNAGVSCPYPKGGFYLFPDWNSQRASLNSLGVTTSNELAHYLLKEYLVSSLPGSEFGMPPSDLCLRLATVDYDGSMALRRFRRDQTAAHHAPEKFVLKVAPSVVEACNRLERFSSALDTGKMG